MSFDATLPYRLGKLDKGINFKPEKYVDLLIKARAELGELKGYSFSMPNPTLLLSPAIIKESLASSEIENINTTIVDVLQNQLFPEEEQRAPDKEVLRYRDAVLLGFEKINKYSLSSRSITAIGNILIPSNDEYRKHQNGIRNDSTGKIIYTPPVASMIPDLMSNLEEFMNDKTLEMDPLIKCAIAHYQFEAIHPFTDGNGRTGRILMVLQLVETGVLSLPILYISGYINKNRNEYYQRLLEVTTNRKWDEYIEFMLKGFYLQAKETKELLFEIMALLEATKEDFKINHKKIYSADLVESLFSYPIVSPVKLAAQLEVHYTTASRYLNELAKAGKLSEKKIGKYHLFANTSLLRVIHRK